MNAITKNAAPEVRCGVFHNGLRRNLVRLLTGIVEIHHLDHIARIYPAQRAVAIAARDDIAVRIDDELRRLNYLTSVLPPRAERVSDVAGDAVPHREIHLVGDFLGLLDVINASGEDLHPELIEFVLQFCIADQLTATIGSPVAAIEQDDPISCTEAIGKAERSAADDVYRQLGEGRADAELFRHAVSFVPDMRPGRREYAEYVASKSSAPQSWDRVGVLSLHTLAL